MNDSILFDVKYNKDGKFWKQGTIKKLKDNGRCVISKSENIGLTDLYLFEDQIFSALDREPPIGSVRIISIHYWFHNICTKVNKVLLFECERIENTNSFKLKYPMNIKIK